MSHLGKPINPQKRLLTPTTDPAQVITTPTGKVRLSDIHLDGDLVGNVLTVTNDGVKAEAPTAGDPGPAGPGAVAWGVAEMGSGGFVTIPWTDVTSDHAFLFSWQSAPVTVGNLILQSINPGVEFTVICDDIGGSGATFLWVAYDLTESP